MNTQILTTNKKTKWLAAIMILAGTIIEDFIFISSHPASEALFSLNKLFNWYLLILPTYCLS